MPPSPSSSRNPQGDSRSSSSASSGADSAKKKTELPPLFIYMEKGEWDKATSRAKRHSREARTWATLRTKSMAADGNSSSNSEGKVSGTKRLALHHACFKLRSSSTIVGGDVSEDPFIENCRFVLLLIQMYPGAAGMRESRHGCLPLHLAAFASSAPRPSSSADDDIAASLSNLMSSPSKPAPVTPTRSKSTAASIPRPSVVASRSISYSSTDTHSTSQTGMTAVMAEERWTGSQTAQQQNTDYRTPSAASPRINSSTTSMEASSPRRTPSCPSPSTYASSPASLSGKTARPPEFLICKKREEAAVQVVNALLDAYPKGIRVDSEGGRLPLHTACAGRATPKVITTLLTAYPAAARHRNKDGFLPLHLAAHWGVSHPSVAVALLKAYPDATVGRNRWERTPLEEALCMAGENGRPHQAAMVRALRKHPSYWTLPSTDCLREPSRSKNLVDIDEAVGDSSSDEEDVPTMEDPLGLMSRLTPRSKARKQFASPKKSPRAPPHNADLKMLIKNQSWRGVLRRLESHPTEACMEYKVVTRGGFVAVSGLTPLHYALERRPPHQVVEALIRSYPESVTKSLFPSGALPLHIACTWDTSPQVVSLLLASAPAASKVADELGNLPLHSACFSGAIVNVVDSLLKAYPKSVLTRNNQGSLPEDICQRLRHENKKVILGLLAARKDVVLHHRRSRSSGEAAGIAVTAMELNARQHGTPKARGRKAQAKQPGQTDQREMAKLGVEVSVNDAGKEELLWI